MSGTGARPALPAPVTAVCDTFLERWPGDVVLGRGGRGGVGFGDSSVTVR